MGNPIYTPMRADKSHWSNISERGSRLGLHMMGICYRWFGYYLAHLLLIPVTAYFFVTGRNARLASQNYLCRIKPYLSPLLQQQTQGSLASFKHMLTFANAALDRLAAWTGRLPCPVDFPDANLLEQHLSKGQGAVLISAHLGNLDMTRALAHIKGFTGINAVVFTEHAQKYNAMMLAMNPDFALNLVAVSSMGADTAMMLKERIDQGELVIIVADRTPAAQNNRVVSVPFFGAPADFPMGPIVLASLMECPVYLFFCLKQKKRYQIYLEAFSEKIVLARSMRSQQIESWVTRYAQRLEYYCCKAPLQWFNFFDFWHKKT